MNSFWLSKPLELDRADLIRFRVDNAGVFQRVAMNNQYDRWSSGMSTIMSIYSKHVGCVLCLLNRTDCMCELGERTSGCSCLKCIYSKLEVVLLQIRAMCRASSTILNKNTVASPEQYCGFVGVSIK